MNSRKDGTSGFKPNGLDHATWCHTCKKAIPSRTPLTIMYVNMGRTQAAECVDCSKNRGKRNAALAAKVKPPKPIINVKVQWITAKYPSRCRCRTQIKVGDKIGKVEGYDNWTCEYCTEERIGIVDQRLNGDRY